MHLKWVKIFFEVFQDENFDLIASVIKIDRRKKRLKGIREKFGFEEVLEIVTKAFADQKDVLELHGLCDTAQDLLRDKDRAQL